MNGAGRSVDFCGSLAVRFFYGVLSMWVAPASCQQIRNISLSGERVAELNRIHEMIAEAVERAPASLEEIAEEAGVSRHSLYLWARGKRNPTPENLARLADALEKRGGELTELAEELREAAEEG